MRITVNGEAQDISRYCAFHAARLDATLATVRRLGGGSVLELGGHPWAMTLRLLCEPKVELAGTVSAEEVTAWPDALPVTRRDYRIATPGGEEHRFVNYSANLERTIFPISGQVDLVLACEIIEHLTRAPHVMLLNANRWLKDGGRILVTTPNGAQFWNPLRVAPRMPAFRCSTYGRHNYVFTMEGLTDLLTACGFEIEEARHLSPYARSGLARHYRAIGRLPGDYLRQKFTQQLHVVARKVVSVEAATRLPKVYAPSPDWELVALAAEPAGAGAQPRQPDHRDARAARSA